MLYFEPLFQKYNKPNAKNYRSKFPEQENTRYTFHQEGADDVKGISISCEELIDAPPSLLP